MSSADDSIRHYNKFCEPDYIIRHLNKENIMHAIERPDSTNPGPEERVCTVSAASVAATIITKHIGEEIYNA
jgi:hypothetical protein